MKSIVPLDSLFVNFITTYLLLLLRCSSFLLVCHVVLLCKITVKVVRSACSQARCTKCFICGVDNTSLSILIYLSPSLLENSDKHKYCQTCSLSMIIESVFSYPMVFCCKVALLPVV